MIANFFNKSKPINIFNILIFLLLYYSIAIFFQSDYEFSPVFFLKKAGLFFLLVLLVLVVNFIIKKNSLTKNNSFAALFFVLLFGTFYESMFSMNLVLANIALLFGFRKIYSLQSNLNTKQKLFDAGFWVGISTLLYAWSIIYIWLIFVGILIFRKLSSKNLVIPIVGFSAPILIYFTYNFYFDTLPIFYKKFTFDYSLIFSLYNQLKLTIPITFLLIILVWSILMVTPKIASVSNKLKFSWNVLLNHLFLSILLIVLAPTKNGSEILFLFFPCVVILSNLLQKSKSVIKNIIVYMFLIISIGVYFL